MWRRWGTPHNFLLPFIDELRKNLKNQNFEKMKKKKKFPGDIIILHMCTKNHNHMRYSSWNTKRDRIFFHFGSFLTLLPPPTLNSPKNENFKKIKTNLTISSFYTSVPKIMIICYTMPEIWHMTDVIIFHFALFFAL